LITTSRCGHATSGCGLHIGSLLTHRFSLGFFAHVVTRASRERPLISSSHVSTRLHAADFAAAKRFAECVEPLVLLEFAGLCHGD
jgi:hypothetical protein